MLFDNNENLSEVFQTVVHEIHRAALDKKHPFRFMALATGSGHDLNNRYVVLRKIDQDLNLYVFTDSRTGKVKDLEKNPACAILLYHPQKRAQVIIKGTVTLHNQDQVAQEYWSQVQGDARKAYNPSVAPGTVINKPEDAHKWPASLDDTHFTVIKVEIGSIEALQLNGLEHLRAQFIRSNGDWDKNWIVP
ncbi:MAG: pyridoxamine 5'-phosphate oxidase family protein [Bacteroidota bacterium]